MPIRIWRSAIICAFTLYPFAVLSKLLQNGKYEECRFRQNNSQRHFKRTGQGGVLPLRLSRPAERAFHYIMSTDVILCLERNVKPPWRVHALIANNAVYYSIIVMYIYINTNFD